MSVIRILYLAANPRDTDTLRVGEEAREIEAKIRTAKHRDLFEVVSRWAVRPDDLPLYFNEVRPHIVHFGGHGDTDEQLILENDAGKAQPVTREALVSLFRVLKENIRVVVLNACFSRPQAEAIAEQIDCVIGMNKSIGDAAAITFAASFYQAIAFGHSIQNAFDQGKTGIMLSGRTDQEVPQLLSREGVDPDAIFLVTSHTTDTPMTEGIAGHLSEPARHLPPLSAESDGPPRNNFASVSALFNEDFVGRVAILADLHLRLQQGDVALTHALPDTGPAAQALRGEGGIGKTQIAVRYAFEHASDYDGTWWMDASRPAMDASAAKLATVLGMAPGQRDTPEIIAGGIRERLSSGRHLLILDNLEDPERLVDFLLQPPGRVLITTRLRSLPTGQVHQVAISIFERHESTALLRKHRPDLEGAGHDEALGQVAEALGDHALAVALAASYLRKRANVTPVDLVERLQRANMGEMEHVFAAMDAGEHAAGYGLSVAASLGLHLPNFRETPAMELLTLAALCHPDDIPVELFVDCTELDQEPVEDWLEKLADVSIIRYDAKGVQVHRLMQEVVRAEVGEDVCRAAIAALLGALNARFKESEDPKLWAMQDGYAFHAEAGIEHAERLDVTEGTGSLANQLGLYHKNRARFDTALALFRTAERIDRKAFGDEHPTVAVFVNNIGYVFLDRGDLDGALECFREAERIDRKAYGDEHPEVATGVNNIGAVLHAQGDLDGALECYREAERIDRKAFGDDHPKVAIRVNNIGIVLKDKGDLDGALAYLREAERIDRKAFGDEHPNVAIRVNNIGGVLQDKGDLDRAIECCREAERIDRKAFGDEHPTVAARVNNIGSVLSFRGDYEGARVKYVEAFRILVRTNGPRSLETVSCAKNLLTVDADPIAIARELVGDDAADALATAMAANTDET